MQPKLVDDINDHYRPEYRRELPHFDRVRNLTPPKVNQRIDDMVENRLQRFKSFDTGHIEHRLVELDREWDIDRMLMAIFVGLAGTTWLLGEKVGKKFKYVFGLQLGFMLFHAVKGWCPPMSLLRRMGVRTVREIDAEKSALKTILHAQ